MTRYTLPLIISIILGLQGCGGGGASTPTPVSSPADTTPPVITVAGLIDVQHEQGTVYTDAGATAIDDVDGNVDVTVSGSVDEAVAAAYNITYSASDKAGNSASATRNIVVQDTIAPVITLNGDANVTIDQGLEYSDLGATAIDSVDGNLEVSVSGSVGTEIGEYTLTYSARDAGGNIASV